MSEQPYPVGYRSVSLVLNFVNVTQPVTRDEVVGALSGGDEQGIDAALHFLVEQQLIKQLPRDEFRTTWSGQQAIASRVLRKARDVQRMWHLSDLSDKMRRGEGGDDS